MKLCILLLLPVLVHSQTFFVSGRDTYSIGKTVEKIKFEGYLVTTDSTKADYIVNQMIDGSYKVVSFNYSYHGYILINDRETGKEITRTPIKGANPAALNGYNASYTIFNHINKKYLPAALKLCPKKGS